MQNKVHNDKISKLLLRENNSAPKKKGKKEKIRIEKSDIYKFRAKQKREMY